MMATDPPIWTDLGVVDGLVQLATVVQSAVADAASGFALPALQGRLLGILRDRQPTMAELGALLGLDKSSTTGLVDRASGRGLVTRQADPADRRSLRVVLTADGSALAAAFAAEVGQRLTVLADELGPVGSRRLGALASQVVWADATARGLDLRGDPAPEGPPASSPGPAHRVAVIIGSTRPQRICPDIAAWVHRTLTAAGPLTYELVDLADLDLPLLDEPVKAALHRYRHDHTRAWSELVSGFAGFVFVLPQYNWGYPAALKNALDYLYVEWRDKPATCVTYGTRGGGKAASQLRQVMDGLHLHLLDRHVELSITDKDVDDDGQLIDVEGTLAPYTPEIEAVGAEMAGLLSAP